MASSDAATPDEYLAELPDDQRELVGAVRDTIVANLAHGFVETMSFGMLSYVIPLDDFPNTYNGQPLGVVALANQKRHVAVYLMGIYANDSEREWFIDAWKATGKKLDMGKSCVRFTKLGNVALDVIGEAVARVSPADLIAAHEAVHGSS